MVDGFVVAFVVIAALFGLIRGVVSQVMAIVGLVAAYFFAPDLGRAVTGTVQHQLGCTRFMAEKASILLVAIAIYVVVRLIGYGIEKLAFSRVSELRRVNRLGGAFLGALKGIVILAVFFIFLALLPPGTLKAWAPRLAQSRSYRLAVRFNPIADSKYLNRARSLRNAMTDPKVSKKLASDPKMRELLTRYEMPKALQDDRLVQAVKDGDFEDVRRLERMEDLMRDDDLERVLDGLSKEAK